MKNRYGVDINYFQGKLSQAIVNLDNYTPAELARVLARLSVTADEAVILNEEEFNWCYELDDKPLTQEEHEAIEALSSASHLTEDKITRSLLKEKIQ
jgi:hypothetical protein